MRSGVFGTRVCQPARAATDYDHTSFLAGVQSNTQPHSVGLCRPPSLRNPAHTRRLSRRIGITERSAYWCLCRRRHNHQLRHAHAVEMAREGVPLVVIQRQLGHAHLGVTSIYLQGIDSSEIIDTVHARRPPMIPASAGLRTTL